MTLDIILITYNQEQYIAQAVESILMQRVNDDVKVRVIVADDCSTDNTLEIIKSYEEKSPYPFVYLSAVQNMGHVRNYQRAFAACDSDYVAILEGDDWWSSPEHLLSHFLFLEDHYECVLSSNSPAIYVSPQNKYFVPYYPENVISDFLYIDGHKESRYNRITNLSSCMIRNSALQNIDKRIYELNILDWGLYICLTQFGLLCRHRRTTSIYRVNENGIWSGKSTKQQSQLILSMINDFQTIFGDLYLDELNEYKAECIDALTNTQRPPSKYKILKKAIKKILRKKQ